MKNKSKCCKAPMQTISADEGTSHWECEKCKEPCDPVSVNNAPTWEEEFETMQLLDSLPLKKTLKHLNVSIDGRVVKFVPESQIQEAEERGRREALEEVGHLITPQSYKSLDHCFDSLARIEHYITQSTNEA